VRITFDVDLVARVSALAAYHRSRRSLSGWASVATEPLMLPSVAGDIVVDPGGRRARKSRSRRHLNHSPIARSSWPKKSECWLSRTKTEPDSAPHDIIVAPDYGSFLLPFRRRFFRIRGRAPIMEC
jgi:hypothetical protein